MVAQLLPRFRDSIFVQQNSPLWWAVCVSQSAWTLIFALDWILFSLVLMLCILISLFGVAQSTHSVPMTPWRAYACHYFLMRAPFSLHLGWIIVASTVNVNLLADSLKCSQTHLLMLAITSFVVLLATITDFTLLSLVVRRPDPIIGFVAAWAFGAIASELEHPVGLNDPNRFNPSVWDVSTLGHLQKAALFLCIVTATMGLIAAALEIYPASKEDEEQPLSPLSQIQRDHGREQKRRRAAGEEEEPELITSREQEGEDSWPSLDLSPGSLAARIRQVQQDKAARDTGGGVSAMIDSQPAAAFADADDWTQIGPRVTFAEEEVVSARSSAHGGASFSKEETDSNITV